MRLLILSFLALLAVGCESTNKQNSTGSLDDLNHQTEALGNSDSLEIVTLPTPLQIPALIKNREGHFNKEALLPIRKSEQTTYKSSLLFGSYLIDMSYAALFSEHQASLDYFEKCIDLGEELGLNSIVNERQITRFKQNVNAPDTLAQVIMEVYDKGHQVLLNQEKEGIGLLMITGCYMEGMHLTVNQIKDQDYFLFLHVLRLQQDYGNNMIKMLDQYEIPEEINDEYLLLKDVVNELNKCTFPYMQEMKSKQAKTSGLNIESVKKIQIAVERFRAGI